MRVTGSLLGVVGLAVLLAPAPAVAADRDVECAEVQADTPRETAASASEPFARLGVQDAWDRLRRSGVSAQPGAGVRVAVLDSGVVPGAGGVEVVAGRLVAQQPAVLDSHGTALAGLVAAAPRSGGRATGFAPGAEIVDVKVYDAREPADASQSGIDPGRLAAGLDWVADQAGPLGIRVAVVGFAVADDPRVRAASERVVDAGVVLVAGSGDRPQDEGEPLVAEFGEKRAGEDARTAIFPAGYPGVLSVNATADGTDGDAAGSVLLNSGTDVAAPTYGAVTAALNGGTCVLRGEISTAYAAAEVAGVLAILATRFPEETGPQLAARLVATADGATDGGSSTTGAGVVQPYEAVTRRLSPAADGSLPALAEEAASEPPARAPEPPADPMVGLRENAVWWALLGGAAVLLAVLVRPLLRRRAG